MTEPLTTDLLRAELIASEERIIKSLTKKIDAATVPHFTALSHDLDEITQRLTAIEKLVWQGQRLEEIEQRLIKLAQLTGNASLAVPFSRPVGV